MPGPIFEAVFGVFWSLSAGLQGGWVEAVEDDACRTPALMPCRVSRESIGTIPSGWASRPSNSTKLAVFEWEVVFFAFATDLLTHILIAGISTRCLSHEAFRCLISLIDSIFNLLFCKQYLIFFGDLCHLGISRGAFRQTLSIWKPMRAIFFPLPG